MKNFIAKLNIVFLADVPDFKPITDYIWGYGLAAVTAVCSLISLFLVFVLVKIGFRIAKASSDGDVEGRSAAIRDIIWASIGAALVFSATIAAGVFSAIFLKN
ncbi:hypothetical protein [Spiroplasma floricola]|uniref:Uncharacterized protein n=1 Tax=Spiroplasma floricola 23-6 TaxID=1336749 RepID=A0A2K8SEY7_9MOLU|nr:hypothetical protein [Spiroplasma floricola]AUB32004.1 hypothetical protein SFLOR_v1c09560 [Spiroplasma floricola 23-6]